MKKVFLILFLMVASFSVDAQVNFLDIPVEGDLPTMIRQLKRKGFKDAPAIYGENRLVGKFYGRDVLLTFQTNNNDEVYCVGVFFVYCLANYEGYDRNSAIKLFNELVYSFNNNDKYLWISWMIRDFSVTHCDKIPVDEDLWYNITQKGIDYHMDYTQLPEGSLNCVHFSVQDDDFHYGKFFVLLMYENLKLKTFNDSDL